MPQKDAGAHKGHGKSQTTTSCLLSSTQHELRTLLVVPFRPPFDAVYHRFATVVSATTIVLYRDELWKASRFFYASCWKGGGWLRCHETGTVEWQIIMDSLCCWITYVAAVL